ncbi:MAG: hypothetical protein GY798_04140 [Hyphomicrobiales bacterium]|nr:hypothetical protein [Hyphomicrobiales bacterium]
MSFVIVGQAVAADLKAIYRAESAEMADVRLEEFEDKLIYLAIKNAGQIAKANTYRWKTALNQFAIIFAERLDAEQF